MTLFPTIDQIIDRRPQNWLDRLRLWIALDGPGFWNFTRGSGSGIFFLSPYGDDWPTRYLVYPLWSIGRGAHNIRYWFKYRLQRGCQFHIIRTGLKPGYADYDTRILHGCMEMVGDFIGESEWIHDVDQEFIDIAHWWYLDKPAEEKRRDDMCHELFGPGKSGQRWVPSEYNPKLMRLVIDPRPDEWQTLHIEYRALENKIDQDEEDMMIRLIKKRTWMWT